MWVFDQSFFCFKGDPVNKEDLFVAVKTCKKFHSERGASPPTLTTKTLFCVQISLEVLLSSCCFCFFLIMDGFHLSA